MSDSATRLPHLPKQPIRRLTRPLARFLEVESASGIVLLACTALALAFANGPAADAYHHFWHAPVHFQFGTFAIGGELGHFFVNDVLMTVFFFVVGLEIKREVVAGELRDPRKAALPVAAALGGMLVPAAIYMALQAEHAGEPPFRGWGVPMATDIAFVVGVMALLGKRVPFGLKIMLLSLAAVATLFASFSSPFLTALFTLGVFVVGRSADTLAKLPVRMFGQTLQTFGKVLARVFPNLQIYVPPRPLLLGDVAAVPTWPFVAESAAHAACYAAVLVALAVAIFRKRDFL